MLFQFPKEILMKINNYLNNYDVLRLRNCTKRFYEFYQRELLRKLKQCTGKELDNFTNLELNLFLYLFDTFQNAISPFSITLINTQTYLKKKAKADVSLRVSITKLYEVKNVMLILYKKANMTMVEEVLKCTEFDSKKIKFGHYMHELNYDTSFIPVVKTMYDSNFKYIVPTTNTTTSDDFSMITYYAGF